MYRSSVTSVYAETFFNMSLESSSNPIKDRQTFHHDNTLPPKNTKVLSLFSNKGKTAIVSGAGAGIGLAVAEALAESGANVAIWYNSNKKAVAEAERIEQEYGVKCIVSVFLRVFCPLFGVEEEC